MTCICDINHGGLTIKQLENKPDASRWVQNKLDHGEVEAAMFGFVLGIKSDPQYDYLESLYENGELKATVLEAVRKSSTHSYGGKCPGEVFLDLLGGEAEAMEWIKRTLISHYTFRNEGQEDLDLKNPTMFTKLFDILDPDLTIEEASLRGRVDTTTVGFLVDMMKSSYVADEPEVKMLTVVLYRALQKHGKEYFANPLFAKVITRSGYSFTVIEVVKALGAWDEETQKQMVLAYANRSHTLLRKAMEKYPELWRHGVESSHILRSVAIPVINLKGKRIDDNKKSLYNWFAKIADYKPKGWITDSVWDALVTIHRCKDIKSPVRSKVKQLLRAAERQVKYYNPDIAKQPWWDARDRRPLK